jgi:glucose-6-phosphate 1-epimerase
MHAAELAAKFRIPGVVEFAETEHGLVKVQVSRGGMTGELFLLGAHVTGWQPASQRPVIFTSAHAVFAPGKAIRGGIPVIFPWFGAHPTAPAAPQHGFARTAEWQLDAVEEIGAEALTLTLSLDVPATASPWWPHAAGLTLRVGFGQELRLDLAVENRSGQPTEFEEALHSYFAVSDVATISLFGLEDCGFIDKTAGMRRSAPARTPLSLTGWTDRVYLDTPDKVLVADPGWRRRVTVAKEGGASTIVWNPWPEKAAAMSDLGADQWRGMICVESGNVADNKIRLGDGAAHHLVTRISVAAGA